MKHCFPLLLFLFTLSSCTKQLFLKAEKAPVIALTPAQKQLILLSTIDQASVYNNKDKAAVYRVGVQQALTGTKESLQKDQSFSVTIADTTMALPLYMKSSIATATTIQEICQRQNATHLLALTNLQIHIQRMSENGDDSPQFQTSGPGRWQYSVLVTSKWRLYASQGQLLDTVTVSVRQPYHFLQENKRSFALVAPALEESEAAVSSIAKEIGQKYARRFYPQTIVVNRPYYYTGPFAPAAEWIQVRNWPEAASLLLPLLQENPEVAAMAAYNLAVVSEAQGHQLEAKTLAAQAAKAGNSYANKMLKELSKAP